MQRMLLIVFTFSCGFQSEADIVKLIHFANQHKISLIPRTAGTSLAGQTVGSGIVVDVSIF
jgi:FAD/FMN-containing dehydrogenase